MSRLIDKRGQTPQRSTRRSKSDIKNIGIHYTATDRGGHDSFWRNTWSKQNPPWQTGGYAEIILANADNNDVEWLYDYDMVTNGVGGQNSYIYNMAFVSRASTGDFTDGQKAAGFPRIKRALDDLGLSVSDVKGHNEFPGQSTPCPNIDMNRFRRELQAYIDGESAQHTSGSSGSGSSSSAPRYGPNSQTFAQYHSDWWMQRRDETREAQRLLNQVENAGLSVDGILGQKTLNAVRAFQDDHGISSSGQNFYGVPGPATRDKLNELAGSGKRTVHLPASASTWRTYRLNVAPVRANSDWSLTPSAFGGLTYDILDEPQKDVVTIQTSRGRRNIYVGSNTSAVIN